MTTYKYWLEPKNLGFIYNDQGEIFTVRQQPKNISIADVDAITVKSHQKSFLQIRDLARVSLQQDTPLQWRRVNGRPSVMLEIYSNKNQNKVKLAKNLIKLAESDAIKLSPKIQISIISNEALILNAQLQQGLLNFTISLLCILLVYLIYTRSLASSLFLLLGFIVTGALVILTFVAGNLTLTTDAIAALPVCAGVCGALLVSGLAIDSKPSLNRHLLRLATLIVLLLSFIIVWYTPNTLPSLTSFVDLMAVVVVSANVVAWWFLPACESLWSNPPESSRNILSSSRNKVTTKINSWLIQKLGSNKLLLILIVLIVFSIPWFMLPQRIDTRNSVATIYNNTIGSTWFTQQAKPFLERYLGGVLQQFHQLTFEKYGYRKSDKTLLVVQASLPLGHKPEQLNVLMYDIERYLLSQTGIEQFVTLVNSAQSGRIEITFKQEAETTGFPWKLKNDLVQMTLQRGGANWVVTGVGNTFNTNFGSGQSFYRWVVSGPTYEIVEQQSEQIVEILQKDRRVENVIGNAGIQGQSRLTNEYILAFANEQLSLQSITLTQVAKALQAASELDYVGSIRAKNANEIPIFVAPLYDKGGLPLFNVQKGSIDVNGRSILLNGTSNMKMVPSAPTILRKNRAYYRVISFSYKGNTKAGDRFAQNTLKSLRLQLPAGCFIGPEEYNELSLPSAHLAWLGCLLLFLCFCVCAMFFNNFRYAAIAMMGIPVSFIFGMALFSIGGFYFDQGGFAATLLLVGFSVYSALLFIDEFLGLKKYQEISDQLLLEVCLKKTQKVIIIPNIILLCSVMPVIWNGKDAAFWFSYSVGLAGGITGLIIAIWIVLPAFLWKPLTKTKSLEKSVNIN